MTTQPRRIITLTVILHGILAIATAGTITWAFIVTGAEILALFLRTSYRWIPIIAGCSAAAFFLANAACAVYAARGARPARAAEAASILTAIIVIWLTSCYTLDIIRRTKGDPASARTRFWTRIGPICSIDTSIQKAADASSSMTIWYFEPYYRKEAYLLYGTYPARERMSLVFPSGNDVHRREFRLTGLKPSTTYYYTAPGFDEQIRSFRTAPRRGDGNTSIRFLCLGDTGNTRRGGYAYSYYPSVMSAARAWYRSQGIEPDFIVHAGDLVRRGDDLDAWHHHFSSFDTLPPSIAAAGNHEFLGDRGGNFRYFFGFNGYGSVDYGDIHILILHPFDGPIHTLDGPLVATGGKQYRFAQQDLAEAGGKSWIVVVIHIPLLSSGDYGNNEILIAQYLDLFRKHGVDLVISGHDHSFDIFHADEDRDGTLFLVAGTGGSHLDSYIMSRSTRRWFNWFHDRSSIHGLYQRDPLTEAWHRYGELSWGFTDVHVAGDTMTLTYCRWLSYPDFLKMTGQRDESWDMREFRPTRGKFDTNRVEIAYRIVKKKRRPHEEKER